MQNANLKEQSELFRCVLLRKGGDILSFKVGHSSCVEVELYEKGWNQKTKEEKMKRHLLTATLIVFITFTLANIS